MTITIQSLLKPLKRIEHGLDAIIQPVVFAGMAALIGVITLQIVSRVLFSAVSWTEEVARFLLVWITFFAGTLAFQRGRHIAGTLAVLAFTVALVVIGYRYMQVQSFQKSASLRLSMTYVYAVIPLCAAVMSWYALVDLLELLIDGERREEPVP